MSISVLPLAPCIAACTVLKHAVPCLDHACWLAAGRKSMIRDLRMRVSLPCSGRSQPSGSIPLHLHQLRAAITCMKAVRSCLSNMCSYHSSVLQ